MELWIATGNQGKLNEYKLLLGKSPFDIHSQKELRVFTPPIENGKTFEENARIKARVLKAVKSGVWILGEDSGLEAAGLNNMPGISSARYAGERASDAENVAKLLKMLQIRSANRDACFRACVVVYSPTGEEFIFNGQMSGTIARAPQGQQGFGYDPVFIPNGETKTLAELGYAFKNKNSHRAQAVRQMLERLAERF